jgi:hypothetical protein
VDLYIWRYGEEDVQVPARRWWVDIRTEGNRRYVVVAEEYEDWPLPTHELLECGHEQAVRIGRYGPFFNRRRRCDTCAREAFIGRIELHH